MQYCRRSKGERVLTSSEKRAELPITLQREVVRSPLAGMVATMCLAQGCQAPVKHYCCGRCERHCFCQGGE